VTFPLCTLCQRNQTRQQDPLLGWVCSCCLRAQSADTPNTLSLGRASAFPSFSLEFEIAVDFQSYDELRRALILLKHGFIRTKDGSVDEEYKSPIYRSLSPFQKVLPVLERLVDLVDGRCGTHLHVALPVKEQLRPLFKSVFTPLIAYLEEHEEQTIAFWGRTFNDYASLLLGSGWGCINPYTNYDTLEFRLPRFRSGVQYLAVVRFCRMVAHFLTQQLRSPFSRSPWELGEHLLATYLESNARRDLCIC